MPARSTAEMWTNASGWPSSRVMKPKPLVALKNLTVPEGLLAGQLALRSAAACALARRAAILDRERIAHHLQVGGRDLSAAIDQLELQLLSFGQAVRPARSTELIWTNTSSPPSSQ